MGQMSRTPTGYTLQVTRDTSGLAGQMRAVSPCRNGAHQPVTGICQHTAEADTG